MAAERGLNFLGQFFGVREPQAKQKEALIDLLLVAALADGDISQADLDRIAKAIESHEQLSGVDWDHVLNRSKRIKEDAPLFADTRLRLLDDLWEYEIRRFGFCLAASFLGSPPSLEERAILDKLAQTFDFTEQETRQFMEPWTDANPFAQGYLRSAFNHPESARDESLFGALERATSEDEFQILMFKLAASRAAMNRLSENAVLASVGERIELAGAWLRVDAFIQVGDASWLARFLAPGEALHPQEHNLLRKLLDFVDTSVSLFIGYGDRLSPPDRAALRLLDPQRAIIEKVQV